jgi:cell division septum initiation protein DivIVA
VAGNKAIEMSTSAWNPVFGEPTQPHESPQGVPAHASQYANGSLSRPPTGDPSYPDAANAEIHSIASAIEELQARLEKANSHLGHATALRDSELEIGRLFVEAQRFSESSISKLEQQIHEILLEAEAKASQILREATEEAHEIRRQAQEAAFVSNRAAQELQSAIAGFTVVNSALVSELNALNTMLTPSSEQQVAEPLGQQSRLMGSF